MAEVVAEYGVCVVFCLDGLSDVFDGVHEVNLSHAHVVLMSFLFLRNWPVVILTV